MKRKPENNKNQPTKKNTSNSTYLSKWMKDKKDQNKKNKIIMNKQTYGNRIMLNIKNLRTKNNKRKKK